MKSRRNQVLLLVGVVFIWGGVLYRFFAFTDTTDNYVAPIPIKRGEVEGATASSGAYEYRLNYRDPFLRQARSTVTKRQLKPKKENRVVRLPEVQYLGMVSSNQKQTGLVKVDGKSYLIEEGDLVGKWFRVRSVGKEEVVMKALEVDSVFTVRLR